MCQLAEANCCAYKFSEVAFVLPLTLATPGEDNLIKKVGGKAEMKKHLEDMGFVVGGTVSVVSEIGGNVIVNVKNSRVALSREMAQKIMV